MRRVVLIYQMPKIGSQTVEATLQEAGWSYPIFRFHYLSDRLLQPVRRWADSSHTAEEWKSDARYQSRMREVICQLIRVRTLLRACGMPLPKLEVITGVRDLIAIGISSIFENYALFAPDRARLSEEVIRETVVHPKTLGPLSDWV